MTSDRKPGLCSLVVAADRGLRGRVASLLRSRGFAATLSSDAKRAWDAIERKRFHLVVLAWPGPNGSAVELCRKIAGSSDRQRPYIVGVIDGANGEQVASALDNGVDDYLNLPADPAALESRLRVVVKHIHDSLLREAVAAAPAARDERFDLAAQTTRDGLWDWNLVSDEIHFSHRWRAMLGLEEQEIGREPEDWYRRVHADDLPRLKAAIAAHLSGGTPTFECEHRMLHRDGSYRWMLSRGLAARDGDERAIRFAGSQSDITDRKRAEEQLAYDAFHDSLTGLANRALFIDRLSQALALARRREDAGFAVLFLDVDQFRLVNDSLGPKAGDLLLLGIARRLELPLRGCDTVARFGGDDFAVLLDGLRDVKQAIAIAERIQQEIRKPFDLDGREVYATASIGIVVSGPGYEAPEDYLRDADTAMYRAKSLGRDGYAVFDNAMHERALSRLQLENDLRRAVERAEFLVHYQPIVSLDTGRIAGFEALARWNHPARGLVLPAEFIPLAEETGLIVPLDRLVIHEACRQLRQWHLQFRRTPPLTVSVNISGVQFMQADLMMAIDRVLRDNGLYGDVLKIEITESVIMDKARYAPAMLEHLRALRIKLSIDDFGTGYSSLAYLRRFEIDTLKIDASFVSRLETDEESSEIVRTIITLARNLGKDVIAEGVETAVQLARLRELGCTFAQGYFLSKPLAGEAATRLIATDRRW